MAEIIKAKIKATSEEINVFKLNNGNYYDYDGMGEKFPPTSKSGKKEFTKDEIELLK